MRGVTQSTRGMNTISGVESYPTKSAYRERKVWASGNLRTTQVFPPQRREGNVTFSIRKTSGLEGRWEEIS